MQPSNRIGRYFDLDEGGFIINNCSRDLLVTPWSDIVEAIRQECMGYFGSHLHSLYVRGSVANGSAVPEISDVDMVAVISREISEEDYAWRRSYVESLCFNNTFMTGVELPFCPLSLLIDESQKKYSKIRFAIKTQSICIYGVDVSNYISRYKPGVNTIFHAYRFNNSLRIAREALDSASLYTDARDICRWVMKELVRSGFDLVMLTEQIYARDLAPCCEAFARNYPERAVSMRKALELAVFPSSDPATVRECLDDLGDWLSQEVTRRLNC